jgi:hypothetical protein
MEAEQGHASFDALCRAVRRNEVIGRRKTTSASPRVDGRNILEPTICSVTGGRVNCEHLSRKDLALLHNEGLSDAQGYPLRVYDGFFFSEAVGDENPEADQYCELIASSMNIISKSFKDSSVLFAELEECGKRIQALDGRFAERKIGKALDSLHRCVGPDPGHPYSKITICRSTFPILIENRRVWFLFEKFLVSYSYLDWSGRRRSTQTPIHSHPINFETVYFASSGNASCAIEQEFHLMNDKGEPLIRVDGTLHPDLLSGNCLGSGLKIRVEAGESALIKASSRPIGLDPFTSEFILRAHDPLIYATDGLFRPHQVTVVDDPAVETRYFALDNYFGPTGRVLIYGSDGNVRVWNHTEWNYV